MFAPTLATGLLLAARHAARRVMNVRSMATATTATASTFDATATLPTTMRAQVLLRRGPDYDMQLQTLDMPVPRANEVLVKVTACGVCHTDLHVMRGEIPFAGDKPAVLGHEMSGHVVAVGAGSDADVVGRLERGTPVVGTFIMPCQDCYQCDRDATDLCENFFAKNRLSGHLYDDSSRLRRHGGGDGGGEEIAMYSMAGMAEYCVMPASGCYELPPPLTGATPSMPTCVPLADAAIIGCSAFTAYGALKNAGGLRAGESIAVIGAGGIGTNIIQFARAMGATNVIAVDVSDSSLAMAKSLGATHTVNAATDPDVVATLQSMTDGRGPDVCVEAIGNVATFKTAVQSVCDGGRAVMVGIAPAGVMADVEITRLVRRKITIVGSFGARAPVDTPAILSLIQSGTVDMTSVITQRVPLSEAGAAYAQLHAGSVTGRSIVDMRL